MRDTEMHELCPLSGIGTPPQSWASCYSRCAWHDPETHECAPLRIVTMLQDLPLEYFNTQADIEDGRNQ